MKFLEVKNAQICFEVVGESGPWITMINGHTRSRSDFKLISRKLAAGNRRVLIFDNRGSGSTLALRPFSFEDFCQDVLELWQHLGIQKSSVLGISMGGFIAQGLAERTDRIEKLILVSTAAKKSDVLSQNAWTSDSDLLERRIEQNFSEEYVARNSIVVRGMINAIEKQIKAGNFIENAQAQDMATQFFDLSKSSKVINFETLILHGEADKIIRLQSAQEMSLRFSKCNIKTFPGCGHLILAERPQELLAQIVDFLDRPSII